MATELFPLFANRLPPASRADYRNFQRLRDIGVNVEVRVRRVNPPPTPMQFRILCGLSAEWPDHFSLLRAEEFEPLHALVPQA